VRDTHCASVYLRCANPTLPPGRYTARTAHRCSSVRMHCLTRRMGTIGAGLAAGGGEGAGEAASSKSLSLSEELRGGMATGDSHDVHCYA
jgi:hypothetical protein